MIAGACGGDKAGIERRHRRAGRKTKRDRRPIAQPGDDKRGCAFRDGGGIADNLDSAARAAFMPRHPQP